MVWLCKKTQLPQQLNNACVIDFTLNLKAKWIFLRLREKCTLSHTLSVHTGNHNPGIGED